MGEEIPLSLEVLSDPMPMIPKQIPEQKQTMDLNLQVKKFPKIKTVIFVLFSNSDYKSFLEISNQLEKQ